MKKAGIAQLMSTKNSASLSCTYDIGFSRPDSFKDLIGKFQNDKPCVLPFTDEWIGTLKSQIYSDLPIFTST